MEPLISVRIRATLSANPECRPGLLARGRVAYAERGRLSHGNGRELFCLVRHYTWPGTGFFYGHVLRVPVRPGAEDSAQWPDGTWAALIVDSGIAIDGETRDEVLANAQEWRWNNGDYQPCYAQDIDDVFKLCTGFEEACAALSEMIRRFELKRRTVVVETEEDYLRDCRRELPAPGILDMRCMNVYGLGTAYFKDPCEEEQRALPPQPRQRRRHRPPVGRRRERPASMGAATRRLPARLQVAAGGLGKRADGAAVRAVARR